MIMIKFVISGKNYKNNVLPSYNDYINQCRSNKWGANAWKHKYQNVIGKQIGEQCDNFYIDKPFRLNLVICESNKRRDLDNVESMAKKLILDTLQDSNYVSNDKLYAGGTTTFTYEKNNSYIKVDIIN